MKRMQEELFPCRSLEDSTSRSGLSLFFCDAGEKCVHAHPYALKAFFDADLIYPRQPFPF